jgi:Domain of unknown function (DUF4132)/TilS substrate binding domain
MTSVDNIAGPSDAAVRPLQVAPWASEMTLAYGAQASQAKFDFMYNTNPRDFPAGQQILALGRSEWIEIVAAIACRLKEIEDDMSRAPANVDWGVFRPRWEPLEQLSIQILRPQLPWSEERLAAVIAYAAANGLWELHCGFLLGQAEPFAKERPVAGPLADALRRFENFVKFHKHFYHDEREKLNGRLQRLFAGGGKPASVLAPGDWPDAILADLEKLPAASAAVARRALEHAIAAMGRPKPSQAFLKSARSLLAEDSTLAVRLMNWVEAFPPRVGDLDPNEDAARGLIWMLGAADGADVAARVGRFCELCFKKMPWSGPRSLKLGNASLQTLEMLGGIHAAAELTRLKSRLRYPRVVGQIEATLSDLAARTGLDPEELEEVALPTFDLSPEGERRLPAGDGNAIIRIAGTRDVRLTWQRADGREVASVPKSMKEAAREAVDAARSLAKDIEGALAGQSARIERLYLSDRRIAFDLWRQRYLDHPLVAALARRLIWSFESSGKSVAGLARSGSIEGVTGQPIEPSADTSVALWHPLRADAEAVLAWRRRLASLSITQPFKQAHREIYVLTDAERQTETYSNRFAAHVLRQHQFKALCDQRGWRYQLMGLWDSHNTPTRPLPRHEMYVEYWVNGIEDAETTAATVYTLIATDQVRFVAGDGTPLPLTDVPPLVFSELMRDVDLFVGVASVGNDPNWVDGGPQARFGAYWLSYAFGDLGQSGKTRAEVLATLLPSLAIAAQCELKDRFLVVRGKLRTYKIHLGSANIQMAPNDQYLCIVPGYGRAGAAAADNLVLPFEGDRTLSIILSKAFLLAADDKITDPAIASQINRA